MSYKIIGAAREVYKELGTGYNIEQGILIIQCNSVKIRGELFRKLNIAGEFRFYVDPIKNIRIQKPC
ncbi:MAG: hypothetical protein LWX51_13770 [Deltaproteobacteria bacterium]|nr:hypothetical protein [Deltaproteobacteria bacterium]